MERYSEHLAASIEEDPLYYTKSATRFLAFKFFNNTYKWYALASHLRDLLAECPVIGQYSKRAYIERYKDPKTQGISLLGYTFREKDGHLYLPKRIATLAFYSGDILMQLVDEDDLSEKVLRQEHILNGIHRAVFLQPQDPTRPKVKVAYDLLHSEPVLELFRRDKAGAFQEGSVLDTKAPLPAMMCGACGKDALWLCDRCGLASYCSAECQAKEYKAHKASCKVEAAFWGEVIGCLHLA